MLVRATFFFSWGAFYSIQKENFVVVMRQYKYVPFLYLPIAIIDTLSKGNSYNLYFHELGIVIGVITLVVITSWLLQRGKIKNKELFANCSFFIFAMHALILNNLRKLVFTTLHLPDTTSALLFLYIIVPILTILICLAVYLFLKKSLPSVCSILTGGR